MAKEMLFLLKNKHENKLENGLMNQEKAKAIMFTFTVKATESWSNEPFNYKVGVKAQKICIKQ